MNPWALSVCVTLKLCIVHGEKTYPFFINHKDAIAQAIKLRTLIMCQSYCLNTTLNIKCYMLLYADMLLYISNPDISNAVFSVNINRISWIAVWHESVLFYVQMLAELLLTANAEQ